MLDCATWVQPGAVRKIVPPAQQRCRLTTPARTGQDQKQCQELHWALQEQDYEQQLERLLEPGGKLAHWGRLVKQEQN
jgi:hypothetical protein